MLYHKNQTKAISYLFYAPNGVAYSCQLVCPSVGRSVRPEILSGLFLSNHLLKFIKTSLEASSPRCVVHIDNMFRFSDFRYTFSSQFCTDFFSVTSDWT